MSIIGRRSSRPLGISLGLAAALLGSACGTLLPVSGDDGVDDHDLSVELGTAKESPADLYVNMAAAYMQRGQIDVALERAKRAVREDDRSARAHYMLGLIYTHLGAREDAEAEIYRAVQINPKNSDYRHAWGKMLCDRGKYREADEQFKQALKNPLFATPELTLSQAGDCARRAGDLNAAEVYWRDALERNPNYGPALLHMAEHNFAMGDATAARQYMGRYAAVAGHSVPPKALLLAVRIERALGNQDAANKLASSLRQRFPDAPEIMELAP
jgi:type IV pilus assembly protein PilF